MPQTAPLVVIRLLGAWLHPDTSFRTRSALERQLHTRAGLVGLLCLTTSVAAGLSWLWFLIRADASSMTGLHWPGLQATGIAASLIAFSVFAPQPMFRTRNAARTRVLLDNPSASIQSWQATTLTFDAVLVGGMLAGLYLAPRIAFIGFGIALALKCALTVHNQLGNDPNARFHALVEGWFSGFITLVAYLIVHPQANDAVPGAPILAMILAAIAALVLGLTFNSTLQWVSGSHTPWDWVRAALDSRRFIVGLVSALLAWVIAWVDTVVRHLSGTEADPAIGLSTLGAFVAGWLALWCGSIWIWRREAMRILFMWSEHQVQIIARLASGSLSPELASRAALPTVTRMAISIFSATRALTVVEDSEGQISTHFVATDRYASSPPVGVSALNAHPHLHLHCHPASPQVNRTGVTIASWLWPGWFMTRSRGIVSRFTNLSALTLLAPMIAGKDSPIDKAFDTMFDPVHGWPTLAAFDRTVDRMRSRADAQPNRDSLVIAVLAIDDFRAIEGCQLEHVAVAQVVHLALAHDEFAGHDVFFAYETPGRIWIALAGGPMVRNSILLVRALQNRINSQAAIPDNQLDMDLRLNVSMGYAAHQIDDFTREGLMATALSRLDADIRIHRAFPTESHLPLDIRPEDIIGEIDSPLMVIDVLNQMRGEIDPLAFPVSFRAVSDLAGEEVHALIMAVGWKYSIGNIDFRDPDDFNMLVNRQPELAEEATAIALDRLTEAMRAADACGYGLLPIILTLPSILLRPDAGHLALPNLVYPKLDRWQCARTVLVFDSIPQGANQALRVLADRGLNIAVTAAAAADPLDLHGWKRWAILFPNSLLQGASGIDVLTIQQTVTAIAGHDTRLIAWVDHSADPRELAAQNIHWTVDPDEVSTRVSSALAPFEPAKARIQDKTELPPSARQPRR